MLIDIIYVLFNFKAQHCENITTGAGPKYHKIKQRHKTWYWYHDVKSIGKSAVGAALYVDHRNFNILPFHVIEIKHV